MPSAAPACGPHGRVLFALWDGEEKGLLGSQHWVHHPTVPLQQLKLAINLDMVGRLRDQRVEVYGTRSMTGLRSLVSHANSDLGLRLDFLWKLEPNGDHHTFFSRQIPIVMFHTGLHDQYHRPSDDAELDQCRGPGVGCPTGVRHRGAGSRSASGQLPTTVSTGGHWRRGALSSSLWPRRPLAWASPGRRSQPAQAACASRRSGRVRRQMRRECASVMYSSALASSPWRIPSRLQRAVLASEPRRDAGNPAPGRA